MDDQGAEAQTSPGVQSGGTPATPEGRQPLASVLIVDDDRGMRATLPKVLELHGYEADVAATIPQARTKVERGSYEIVLLDLIMPDEPGIDFLSEIAPLAPRTAVIVLTGVQGFATADEALQRGAYDFIRKPYTAETLLVAIQRCLRHRQRQLESVRESEELQELLSERQRVEAQLRARLAAPRQMVFRVAALVAESASVGGAIHLSRVSRYSEVIAAALSPAHVRSFPGAEELADRIGEAAYLHDIGHIALPDSIWGRPGPLTPSEQLMMQRHTALGADVLAVLRECCEPAVLPTLELAIEICRTHHERIDGTGYPEGLEGAAVPLSGRVAGLVDLYDSITSWRAYRPRSATHERAVEIISEESARGFDEYVVAAFLACEEQVKAIRAELPDSACDEPAANGNAPLASFADCLTP